MTRRRAASTVRAIVGVSNGIALSAAFWAIVVIVFLLW